jgi:DNA-binding beta-propeller fold protein YncE
MTPSRGRGENDVRTSHISVLIALVAVGATVSGRSEQERVEVLNWQPPRTGWLYVIDATTAESRIFVFNPERGEVTGTIRTGYNPDIAVPLRGDRLYLASEVVGCGQPNCDQLAVIDAQAGRVLSMTPIPDRVHYKMYPGSSRMAVSADGGTVYVVKWEGLPSGDTPVALAAFDTVHERFLDGVIDLGPCGSGAFVPAPDDHLGFHCAPSNELAFYRLSAPDRGAFEFSVRLPFGKRLFAQHVYSDVSARAFMLSADRRGLFVAGGDGAIGDVNLALGSVRDTPVPGNQTEVVAPFASPGALERARFYVGVGPYGQGVAREIRVFDTNTWARVGTIRTSAPFVSAVATSDGSMIYALTGEDGKVLAIDPAAQRELRAMPVGRAPSFALIAP